MGRMIDADALMKEFSKFVKDSNNSDFADVPTWNDAVSLVESAPTIELERKKGRWIDLRCSECGQVDMSKPNFCPNCGARMVKPDE